MSDKLHKHSPLWFEAKYLCKAKHNKDEPCPACIKKKVKEHEAELYEIAYNPNY